MGVAALDYGNMDDAGLIHAVRGGDRLAFRAIMQRYNQRLFRVARAVTGQDDEAEDVLQESYLRAFAALNDFRGEAGLLTWLTAITLNEARGRLRKRRNMVELSVLDSMDGTSQVVALPRPADPEAETGRGEARKLLELVIDRLPVDFRMVFLLREVEGYSVEETAAQLEITPQTVKTRLHRARRLMRQDLQDRLTAGSEDVFPFLGQRCAGIADRVMEKIGAR